LDNLDDPIANILPVERNSMQKEENSTINSFLNVYPNPSSNLLWVDYHGTFSISYELYDIAGHIITFGQLQDATYKVSELPSGLYFIRFYTESHEQFHSKFVKI